MTELTKPTPKFYSSLAISSSSFLFGPLAAGYFLGKNFAALGKNDWAKYTYWIGNISMLVLAITLNLLSEDALKHVPRIIIPMFTLALTRGVYQQYQKKQIDQQLESGTKTYSFWRVLGISLLTMILSLIYFIAVSLILIAAGLAQ